MKYRPEIDGLRAVALIPVIFFHAEITAFSGGFVGVDVFFVISGYLITTIILIEMEQESFSLANFYERRARRILPALFLVMLASLPFAWLWMAPRDMKDFSQSLIAVSTFSSNIQFWRESGYWDVASEMKPLLHTWSLAVEEQYYIFFPLFLMLMWRFRKCWILGSFLVLTGISLALTQWGTYDHPSATFYLLPTRLWELAIGSVIAFYIVYRKKSTLDPFYYKWVCEVLGMVGLLLVGYAVFAFDKGIPYPSLYTLIPTIGTGLVIVFSSQQTITGSLLSTKPFVALGLISYSAYLWHQPLLTFARHETLTEPSKITLNVLAFLSIPLAYLSWRYVEKPFRSRDIFGTKAIFSFSVIGSITFILIGLAGHFSNGFNYRATNGNLSAKAIENKLKVNPGLSITCMVKFTLSPDCKTDDKPEILVWGDSFAMHLVHGIIASKPNAKIIQMTKSVCGPFFDVAPIIEPRFSTSWGKDCLEFNANVRSWLENNNTIKYAVLASPFHQYLSPNSKLLSRDGQVFPADTELVVKQFEKTLNELRQFGITTKVFSPPPATGFDLGRCLANAEWRGMNLEACDFEVSEISEARLSVYEFLKSVNNTHSVVFLSDLICQNNRCITHLDKNFIYRDKGHFSQEGSAAVGKKYDFYKMIVGH